MQTLEALETIKSSIANSLKMVQVREVGQMKPGQFIRQGDLYIDVGDIKNKGAARKELQLVPGNTTGSRHCVIESPHVQIFESLAPAITIQIGSDTKIARFPGPLIIATQDFSISHPKHGWMSRICKGIYQTWQQCDYMRQRAQLD